MIWFETAVCNCIHPQKPCAFSGNTAPMFSQFLGRLAWLGSCQHQAVLQVTPPQPPFPPLPGAFISLSRMPWRRDLAHSREIPPFTVFKTVHCVLLQVLKDFSPLLSWPCFFFSFFSPPLSRRQTALSLSNKMSPHKMNKSKRLRVYQTSYQALRFEQRHQKKKQLFIT